jgi:hypothetical protein
LSFIKRAAPPPGGADAKENGSRSRSTGTVQKHPNRSYNRNGSAKARFFATGRLPKRRAASSFSKIYGHLQKASLPQLHLRLYQFRFHEQAIGTNL